MTDVAGGAADQVFAAGGPSVFFSSGDGTWTPELTVTGDKVNAVWVLSRTAVYACTEGGLVFRSNGGGKWSEGQRINGTGATRACYSIWGSAPENIYLGTSNGIYHGAP
jgi:hypothetical protein